MGATDSVFIHWNLLANLVYSLVKFSCKVVDSAWMLRNGKPLWSGLVVTSRLTVVALLHEYFTVVEFNRDQTSSQRLLINQNNVVILSHFLQEWQHDMLEVCCVKPTLVKEVLLPIKKFCFCSADGSAYQPTLMQDLGDQPLQVRGPEGFLCGCWWVWLKDSIKSFLTRSHSQAPWG